MKLEPALPLILASFAVLVASPLAAQSSEPPAKEALRLEQVLSATARHPLVGAAQARLDAARGARRTAGALPNPVAGYQVENAPFPGQQNRDGLIRETAATLTLPIEMLYQRSPRVRQANEEIRAAESEVIAVRRSVALNATRAFYRVALAQISLGSEVANRDGLDRLVAYNQKRVAEGVTPEGDLLRVKLERDRAAMATVLAEVELTEARAELRPYLAPISDFPPLDSVTVETVTPRQSTPLPPLPDLLSHAKACRPELVVARARVAAASAQTSLQRALTIRQLGATFGQKRVGTETSMIAGLSLPIPLFDRNSGEVQRASAERLAAERELEWAERSIASELAAAREAVTLVSSEVARLGNSFIDRAEEIRRINIAAYEDGAASLLQVLDASRTLNDATLGYYRAAFTEKQRVLELTVAAGSEPRLPFTTADLLTGCAAGNPRIEPNP